MLYFLKISAIKKLKKNDKLIKNSHTNNEKLLKEVIFYGKKSKNWLYSNKL